MQTFDAIESFAMSKMKKAQNHTLVVLQLNLSNCNKNSSGFPEYFKLVTICLLCLFKVGIDIAKLDSIIDDMDFTEKLISEQSVFCLPGKVKYGKFLRILLTDLDIAVIYATVDFNIYQSPFFKSGLRDRTNHTK